MNKKYIKLILCIACLMTSMLSSCIKDEEEEPTSDCYITSFYVGDITSYLKGKASDGTDSLYSRTISGSSVKFNIDQVNGRIYSVDSLPSWTNLTRVVISFGSKGNVYARLNNDSTYYQITSGRDSLDLSTPLDLLVAATDGVSYKHYTAVIYRYAANADSLLWTTVANNLQMSDNIQFVNINDDLYVFGMTGGQICVSHSTDGSTWTTPTAIVTAAASLDYASITVFDSKLYALDSDGTLYGSTDGQNWSVASTKQLSRLLGADLYYLYGYDGSNIVATNDLIGWKMNGQKNLSMMPDQCISMVSYPSRTNPDLLVDVLAGLKSDGSKNAMVWYKISAETALSNQLWDYITVTSENPYPLTALNHLEVFHYNDVIYALGGDNHCFYRSDDNGVTWQEVTEYQFPPIGMLANKDVKVLVNNKYVWMIQADESGVAHIWKGIINKYQ